MNINEMDARVYAMCYVLEVELGFDGGTDEIRNEIKQDFDNDYLTLHETSKGITAHYFDGMKEAVAYFDDNGYIEILEDDEAEEFCKEERIYIAEM